MTKIGDIFQKKLTYLPNSVIVPRYTKELEHAALAYLAGASELMGVEIELEASPNSGFMFPDITKWAAIKDGSLRDISIEYVFNRPYFGAQIIGALKDLETCLIGAPLSLSYRTSTHVHINILDLTTEQLVSMILLYALAEPAIYAMAGAGRVNNNYCVPFFYDNHGVREVLATLLESKSTGDVARITGVIKDLRPRYSGLNLHSIIDHGSLEFRHFRASVKFKELIDFVNIPIRLKNAAKSFDNPVLLAHIIKNFREKEEIAHFLAKYSIIDANEDIPTSVVGTFFDIFPNKSAKNRTINPFPQRFLREVELEVLTNSASSAKPIKGVPLLNEIREPPEFRFRAAEVLIRGWAQVIEEAHVPLEEEL